MTVTEAIVRRFFGRPDTVNNEAITEANSNSLGDEYHYFETIEGFGMVEVKRDGSVILDSAQLLHLQKDQTAHPEECGFISESLGNGTFLVRLIEK